ncbi:hypothetical protein CALCODRAFT_511299 [Calocera cornea HHB12733]|uniref:Uncharacterized protein n=1 Tax=Calocera cornea HHB12733 TaxID=1353952 RepID=A0A165DUS0_9BASI|nr:hypothetical protein CALCODRAFT_511299 [Calocera cornea HHB12733]
MCAVYTLPIDLYAVETVGRRTIDRTHWRSVSEDQELAAVFAPEVIPIHRETASTLAVEQPANESGTLTAERNHSESSSASSETTERDERDGGALSTASALDVVVDSGNGFHSPGANAVADQILGVSPSSTTTRFGTVWLLLHERGAKEVEVLLRPQVDLGNIPLDPPAGILLSHIFKAASRLSVDHAHPLERFVPESHGAYMVATATLPVVSCEGDDSAYYCAPNTGYHVLGSLSDLIEPDGPVSNTPILRGQIMEPTYKAFVSRVESVIGQSLQHISDRAYIIYLIDCSRSNDLGEGMTSSLATPDTVPASAFMGLGTGSPERYEDDGVDAVLYGVGQALSLPRSPTTIEISVGEGEPSRGAGLPTPPPDVIVQPRLPRMDLRAPPVVRRRRDDTISSIMKEPNFQHIVAYLASRFPDIERRMGSQLRGALSRDPPFLFKERTQAYMDVCEGLDMSKMRPSDKFVAVHPESGWTGEINCRHVAAWFSSFPRAKELERATLVNHRGVLIRWDRLWTDKEGLYHRKKHLLGTVDAEGAMVQQMAAIRLLGVVGYLFTTDNNKRQDLVPAGVEDDYLKKPAISSWSWGEIEEGIEKYFPEYAARTRRRNAVQEVTTNDTV